MKRRRAPYNPADKFCQPADAITVIRDGKVIFDRGQWVSDAEQQSNDPSSPDAPETASAGAGAAKPRPRRRSKGRRRQPTR